MNERLARAIHEDYVRRLRAEGATARSNPSLVAWDDLPETLQASNRGQARDIEAKLLAIGCRVESVDREAAELFEFPPEELEILARMEHDRWVGERLAGGWVFGPEKDARAKTSPYVVPWEALPEDVKEIDRDTVRSIPVLLSDAGLRVIRDTNQGGFRLPRRRPAAPERAGRDRPPADAQGHGVTPSVPGGRGDQDRFWALVSSYEREAQRRDDILAEIGRRFRRETAIMVVDTCGFTRITRGQGVIAFLVLLKRLEGIFISAVERAGGRMLFREADNFFGTFPDPNAAVACGRAILATVDEWNEGVPPDERLAIAIAVGHGDVLLVGSDMIFGDEMNLACKVGEDIAGPGELMLTEGACRALEDSALHLEERRVALSGVEFTAYLVKRA
jgi:adenylate cyclase